MKLLIILTLFYICFWYALKHNFNIFLFFLVFYISCHLIHHGWTYFFGKEKNKIIKYKKGEILTDKIIKYIFFSYVILFVWQAFVQYEYLGFTLFLFAGIVLINKFF